MFVRAGSPIIIVSFIASTAPFVAFNREERGALPVFRRYIGAPIRSSAEG
jgi:hypothetical protein